MDIILSGYNVDTTVLEQLKNGTHDGSDNVTPEVISAAYARISRSDKSATELREESLNDVAKARKSNQNIVFDVGHHSVAEHALFNFDVIGISRLALEALEDHRIGTGFTEKSQRYVTLDGDFVVPKEFSKKEVKMLEEITDKQIAFYNMVNPELLEFQKDLHPELWKRKGGKRTIKGWAKEDARYALNLATEGQVGFSANGRALEHIIRRAKNHPLQEVREMGARLYAEVKEVAPSLVALADEELFKETTGGTLEEKFFAGEKNAKVKATDNLLDRWETDPRKDTGPFHAEFIGNPDNNIIAGLIATNSDLTYEQAMVTTESLPSEEKINYVKEILTDLGKFDPLPREFEMGEFVFDVSISSSCYAQLKRHRINTQLIRGYDTELGFTIPDSIKKIGREEDFKELMWETERCYEDVRDNHPENPKVAEYLLTNAHRRRVIVKMNVRELYHFSRQREDGHAQWDIRELATKMSEYAKKVAPATTILLGGKDKFDEIKEKVYHS